MEAPPPTVAVAAPATTTCAACHTGLSRIGSQPLRDKATGDTLGTLGGLFADCDQLDVYVCPRCGRVEFFVEGISQQIRDEVLSTGSGQADNSRSSGSRSAVGTLFQEAWRLDQQEQWEEAIAHYEQVLEKFPGTNFARDAEQRLCKIRIKFGK